MKIKQLFLIILVLIINLSIYSQTTPQEDKYTSINIMVNTVTTTELGNIVEYFAGGKFRQLFLPTKFYFGGIAVKVVEDDPHIAPQMSVIYKNLVPVKVKIYMPAYPVGYKYPVIPYLSKELIDKFNSTNKIEIQFKD
jgi:hypothetical protein